MLKSTCVMAGLILTGAALGADSPVPPKFTASPTAARVGDTVTVAFAVSVPTDVAVYVLDAKGEIVRHLVAGVLGEKAPAPLKPGLAQSLEWDGRDDDGRPAAGGPFRVRVAAGLKPVFDRFLMHNPDVVPRLQAIAGAPGGDLYVLHTDPVSNGNQGGLKIRALGRDGRYRRMLLPYPADLPHEKVKPLGAFQDEEGRLVPLVQNYQTLSLWPDTTRGRGRTLCTGCPAVDHKGGVHWVVKGGRIASLDSRGGCPYETFLGPELFPGDKTMHMNDPYKGESVSMAVGEGDRYLYLSALSRQEKGKTEAETVPCIYRVSLATRDKPEVFVGSPSETGKTGKRLIKPTGVACANGLVYVADPAAGRIAAFSEKDGSLAGEIKTEAPHFVGVDAKSGAVYAVCGPNVTVPSLVKFDSIQSGKEVCRVTLPASTHTKVINHRLAVDGSGASVRVWVAIMAYLRDRICAIDDGGATLKVVDEFLEPMSKWARVPQDLSVDRTRGELYISGAKGVKTRGVFRLDDRTGEIVDHLFAGRRINELGWVGYSLVAMADGSLVTFGNGRRGGLKRWDRTGKALAWEGATDNGPTHTGILQSNMTLGPVGGITAFGNDFYIVSPNDTKGQTTRLEVYGLDGKRKRVVVWGVNVRDHPRLDARGNIYLAAPVRPKGRFWPEFFDDKAEKPQEYNNSYNYVYGSIVKFPPEGGAMYYTGHKHGSFSPADVPEAIRGKPTMEFSYPSHAFGQISNGSAQGAEWMRLGYAPYSSKWGAGTTFCHCENSGFDVDPFGRVFYPNLGQFRVEMVDTANNWIGSFGHYGNSDSGGKDATVKVPDIPLAWPAYVAVSARYAYVSDSISLRIVKVRLDYAADQSCEVK